MNKSKLFSTLLFIVIVASSCAAYKARKAAEKITAREHIHKLSEGILLIRIDDRERELNQLNQIGNHKKAETREAEIDAQNQKIISAFKNHYNFSKFCFYPYGSGKEVIVDRDYSSIYNANNEQCELDWSLPIYFLFHDRDSWPENILSNPSFIIHKYDGHNIQLLEKPFPAKFKPSGGGLFKSGYDFNQGVEDMNILLTNYLADNPES